LFFLIFWKFAKYLIRKLLTNLKIKILKTDTGSPAIKDGSLVGLLSFGRPRCRKSIPGVFASFKNDYIWIYHTFSGALQGLNYWLTWESNYLNLHQ
jgi:hypothetical protein